MREKRGGCDSEKRYPNSVTTLLRRRVSRRERGGVRIRDRAIHPLRFLITRRVYVKALRKTTHLALRSLAQCYAMNVSPVKKKRWGKKQACLLSQRLYFSHHIYVYQHNAILLLCRNPGAFSKMVLPPVVEWGGTIIVKTPYQYIRYTFRKTVIAWVLAHFLYSVFFVLVLIT